MHCIHQPSCGCHLGRRVIIFFQLVSPSTKRYNNSAGECMRLWLSVVTISRNAFLFIIFYNKEMSFSIEYNGELNGH